ncbi:hypothetical protein ACQKMV_15440 [Lysinibacillus sp. NPDC094403]|uniref:hypothetical protein n=1 Tax=Lysinibacillus sp. NPDC094403 TaxID=3390581 RepID=UPI003D03A469
MVKKDIVKPLSILLALAIDLFIAHIILFSIGAVTGYSGIFEFLVKIALYMLLFGVVPSFTNGATLGMKMMRFTMVSENGKSIVSQSWRRCIAIIVVVCTSEIITTIGHIKLNMDSPFYVLQIVITLLAFVANLVLTMVIAIHVLRVIVSGGRHRFYMDHYACLIATRKK